MLLVDESTEGEKYQLLLPLRELVDHVEKTDLSSIQSNVFIGFGSRY